MTHWVIWAIFQTLAITSSPEWRLIGFVLFWTGAPLVLIALWRAIRAASPEAAIMQQGFTGLMGVIATIIATTFFAYSPPGGRILSIGVSLALFCIGLFLAIFISEESRER